MSTNRAYRGYDNTRLMHKDLKLVLPNILRLLLPGLAGLVLWGAASADSGWQSITEGVDYRPFKLKGPVRAFVARMDLDDNDIILEAGLAHGTVREGYETVSAIATRYEDTLNTWTGHWGARSDVVVSINGSYFDLESGVADDGLIQSRWYASKYNDLGGTSGLAWKSDRSLFIGRCAYNNKKKQYIKNVTTGAVHPLDKINSEAREDQIVLLSPQFGTYSFGGGHTEVLVEMTQPVGPLPGNKSAVGIVRDVYDDAGPIPIPFDHIVLTARNGSRELLRSQFHTGDVIAIEVDISHLDEKCERPAPDSWDNTYTSVAGNWVFLRDGKTISVDDHGANVRNPRTALCYNDSFLYFVVVDGRDDSYSIGMTIAELADFCQDRLDAEWGVNMDGGGSSALWVDGQVKNNPSDGHERGVANTLMMVLVSPKESSDRFSTGQPVQSLYPTNVHLGPGLNYPAIASVDVGAPGAITFHMNQLNGILATGTYWWKVDFGGLIGWVDEAALETLE